MVTPRPGERRRRSSIFRNLHLKMHKTSGHPIRYGTMTQFPVPGEKGFGTLLSPLSPSYHAVHPG
jgi:hypothetical protein